MHELARMTIAAASRGLERRSFSALELLDAVLARVEETEPRLHAYARVTADAARREAAAADREISVGRRRGLLHGIPVAVKDLCYTAGVATEAGSRAMAGFVPSFDATVVRRLREAGAVIVGKTVTHEFAYGQNIPVTRNPWHETMYPGGSSVGSGVAVAVGSAMGAIGTDTGGSIRVPASIMGIVGLKPTFGRVSRHGVLPLSWSLDHVGPLTRTVEDCAIMLGAIAGHDPLDPMSSATPVPDYRAGLEEGVEGLRLGVDRDYYYGPGVDPEVAALVRDAERVLAAAGAEIVPVVIPELAHATVIGMTLMQPEASAAHRERLRRRLADYEDGTRLMLEFGNLIPAAHYVTAQRARRWFQAAIRDAFRRERLDALLAPSLPIPTMPREESVGDFLGGTEGRVDLSGLIKHGIVANVAGLPALSVPCGLAAGRLPVGLQIVGRPFAEATVLRIGRAHEVRTDWVAVRDAALMGKSR
jgi:aspartyl-tRNA(Asn)/glutamyl-tRNA(Gln) amidotransferase subunit A